MLRSLFVRTLLTGFVLATGSASVAIASEARQALNIGFVLYTKGNVPGTLNARWTYQNISSIEDALAFDSSPEFSALKPIRDK
jgi:hypothetical protein